MSKSEKKFLIRSSNEILGPYHKEDITHLIKTGKISVFDEIAEPFSIWQYLEYHRDFKKTVQSMTAQTRLTNFLTQLKSNISRSDKIKQTKTDTYSNTETQTDTKTDTMTLSQLDRDSADEVSFNLMPTSSNIKKPVTNKQKPNLYSSQQEQEEKTRKKISFILKLSWQFTILSALLIVAFISYKVIYQPIKEKNQVLQDFTNTGLSYYHSGNYTQALSFFEKAAAYNLLNDKQLLVFASLLLQKNQSQKTQNIKNQILDKNLFNKPEGILLTGLIDFYDKNYSQAEKQFQKLFSQTKNIDLTHIALINLAILNWETNQNSKSLTQLNTLLSTGYERDLILYLQALNMLAQNQFQKLENYILNDLSINNANSLVHEYKQELYFLLAYAYMKQNKTEELNQVVTKLLNQDPFFNQDSNYPVLIAKNNLNWSFLFPYCERIFNFDKTTDLLQALYGYCLTKTNKFKLAESSLEELKNKNTKNPLYLALYAYFLMYSNQDSQQIEQVFLLINYKNLTKEQPLTFILKAHFLEEQLDWNSALYVWKDLLSLAPSQLSAKIGIAFTNYKLNDLFNAERYSNKSSIDYPHSAKLLFYTKQNQ